MLYIKYIFDCIVSFLILLLLFPFLFIISILIKLDSIGPVFFIQERIGKDGLPFKIIKFRTMTIGAEEKTQGQFITSNNKYLTKIGRFLRKYSLDELPEFINVLKGEMSFVGPRPTLRSQVEKYTEEQKKRLKMKPGVTGWAQINGRNEILWVKKIEMDIWYIENWSLILDLKILLKTIPVVLKRKGIYALNQNDDIIR